MSFTTSFEEILNKVEEIDPVRYGKTRNYESGAVTRLSPYISRGVISTQLVYNHILSLNLPFEKSIKLIQELAWRDYWQQVWKVKGSGIDQDLKNTQSPVASADVPVAIVEANTGINAIDRGIRLLYETGYMHNHMRMYVASIACNIANAHWFSCAKWMYSHLYDADWASNALSWQWVAGANANKKYYANQDNINRYFDDQQKGTFLDVGYDEINNLETPKNLMRYKPFELKTELPSVNIGAVSNTKRTLVYNYYNLDPTWHKDKDVQRILLLEPSFFQQYPITLKNLEWFLKLSKIIPNLTCFVGEFNELVKMVNPNLITYKEHPTNVHYMGSREERDWMFDVEGYFPSFFGYWKKCLKQIER
jgi:deoxyribodipyrimidine photo-lyase